MNQQELLSALQTAELKETAALPWEKGRKFEARVSWGLTADIGVELFATPEGVVGGMFFDGSYVSWGGCGVNRIPFDGQGNLLVKMGEENSTPGHEEVARVLIGRLQERLNEEREK